MARDRHSLTIETLGDLIDEGYRMTGWCDHCGQFRPIDLRRLATFLYRDWVFIGRRVPVKCAKCGRSMTTQISAPTPPADMVKSSGFGRPRDDESGSESGDV